MRTDFFGNEVNIGDIVAFNEPRYKGLTIGTIAGFTPKGFQVDYKGTGFNSLSTGLNRTVAFQVVKKIVNPQFNPISVEVAENFLREKNL